MVLDMVFTKLFPSIGIPFLEAARSTGSMEGDWDNRARLNALMAATGEADEKKAEASALRALETRILKGIRLDDGCVLEIGCGIGNLLKPLSARAREVHGVDISGEMLKQATERLAGHPNIVVHKTDGRLGMFPDKYFDFVRRIHSLPKQIPRVPVFPRGEPGTQTRWRVSIPSGRQKLSAMASPQGRDSPRCGLYATRAQGESREIRFQGSRDNGC